MQLVEPDFPRKPLILVVDDDSSNREVLEIHFRFLGAEVLTASDGLRAVEIATGILPDLILLDAQMPRMNGFEACRTLKANPATQFVPVIMVTALEGDEDKIKAVEAGADDFITKPYSSLLLMTRARALLKIKHLNDQVRSRNQLLRQVLNRYVAEEVADTILTDPEKHLKLGGEIRTVTVLFADIRGFTSFTEQHPAARTVETLNRTFSALTPLIFKHRGTLDKYLGDALLAFYGAPLAGPDDPVRAVQTALEMQAVFEQLRTADPELLGPLGLGIGLHSGEATLGNIGSEKRMDYTVIGDTVNIAQRLQEEAQGGEILISEVTYDLVHNHLTPGIRIDCLGPRPIRGRSEPVTVYSLTGRTSS